MKKQLSQVDSTGQTVPRHLIDVFTRAGEIKEAVRTLTEMHRTVKDGIAAGDKLYAFIRIKNLEVAIGNVKRILRFAIPFAACRFCEAGIHNSECRACNGSGFLNKQRYIITLQGLK